MKIFDQRTEKKDSFEIQKDIIDQGWLAVLTGTMFKVYACLIAKSADKSFIPSNENIAEISGVHKRTVPRVIEQLEKYGFLKREFTEHSEGQKAANNYTLFDIPPKKNDMIIMPFGYGIIFRIKQVIESIVY